MGGTAAARGRAGGSLIKRTVAVSALLSAVIGGTFFILALAIDTLRHSEFRASRALEMLGAANNLERTIIQVETSQRGYVITNDLQFLKPWYQARADYMKQAAALQQLARTAEPDQHMRADQIAAAGRSYIEDYAIPLIAVAEHDPSSARTVPMTQEGEHRIDALRARFERFMTRERQIFTDRQDRADAAAGRALVAASAGAAGSILLILFSGGHLARSVVGPVRQVSQLARRVAGGDLSTRMPDNGPGEVGGLERSFNRMTDSLETSRAQIAASRARVVAAADETRRRIERDLHDGTQQRLLSLALELRAAESRLPPGQRSQLWSRIAQGLTDAVAELREISRGLHPAILEEGGLAPAMRALARRAGVPVELRARVPARLPPSVEVAGYYVVSEALANAAKHAYASAVSVDVEVTGNTLRLLVRDDGVGGADKSRGSGLIGLADRVEAAGGTMQITSPPGRGTTLLVRIPVPPA